ncbi:MAG: CAP domain-containing protein [Synechococcales bacterium]|nr:CAP domain-containing protein [Synechococcales bacterium]
MKLPVQSTTFLAAILAAIAPVALQTVSSTLLPNPAIAHTRIAQTRTAPAPTPRLTQATATTSLEQTAFQQVNAYRASKKLPPLKWDERIAQQSRLHSQAMANKQVPFSHQGFEQRLQRIHQAGLSYSSAAENVAYNMGYADPVTQAVQGWIKSTGHRRNMEGNFTSTGLGVARNARGEVYFTQIFIR